jgi:hemerythrin-like domain-containing protein
LRFDGKAWTSQEIAMTLKYSSTRILHDDHMATLALLADVERIVLARRDGPGQIEQQDARFLDRLCKALKFEVGSHFDFEESSILPMLAEYGEPGLGELLLEEHHVLRDVIRDVVALAEGGRSGGFSAEQWRKFRRLCGELVERLTSHIEKEERALLPVMEEALTPDADSEIAAHHDL